jgi:hypothetical protein
VAGSYKSLQDAAYGPFASGGYGTRSHDTPAHWPLGRRQGPLAQVLSLGAAAAITRPTSAIRRPRPERGG